MWGMVGLEDAKGMPSGCFSDIILFFWYSPIGTCTYSFFLHVPWTLPCPKVCYFCYMIQAADERSFNLKSALDVSYFCDLKIRNSQHWKVRLLHWQNADILSPTAHQTLGLHTLTLSTCLRSNQLCCGGDWWSFFLQPWNTLLHDLDLWVPVILLKHPLSIWHLKKVSIPLKDRTLSQVIFFVRSCSLTWEFPLLLAPLLMLVLLFPHQ